MKIAVLSGKGGTGKTFVSVNLASSVNNSVYVDCDVEEPNGRLFFSPINLINKDIFTFVPSFNMEKCTGCRKCVDFCSFNAIAFIKGKPRLFTDVCHACGGCSLVCPAFAIKEDKRLVGKLEIGKSFDTKVITGILNLGEASATPVISGALNEIPYNAENVFIDCPPGSSCSVMESIKDADFCLIVCEGTAFGLHNFKMVYELSQVLGKKCGVVINKYDNDYPPLIDYCNSNGIEILYKIPFLKEYNSNISKGQILSRVAPEIKNDFMEIYHKIRRLVL